MTSTDGQTNPDSKSKSPAPPTSLDKLVEVVVSPDSRTERVIELINRHQGLAEAIVHRANSPEFALRHQIARVEHAMAVLGQNRTVDTIKKFETASQTAPVPAPHFLPNPESIPVAMPNATT